MTRNRFILLSFIFSITTVSLVIGYRLFLSVPSVIIQSDSLPVVVEIGNRTTEINANNTKIKLDEARSYKYRAVYKNPNSLMQAGSINVKKDTYLILSFKKYSEDAIKKALCKNEAQSCIFKNSSTKTEYFIDNTWAVSHIQSTAGPATAVLRLEQGSWSIVSGPGTDLSSDSTSFPKVIQREVEK